MPLARGGNTANWYGLVLCSLSDTMPNEWDDLHMDVSFDMCIRISRFVFGSLHLKIMCM